MSFGEILKLQEGQIYGEQAAKRIRDLIAEHTKHSAGPGGTRINDPEILGEKVVREFIKSSNPHDPQNTISDNEKMPLTLVKKTVDSNGKRVYTNENKTEWITTVLGQIRTVDQDFQINGLYNSISNWLNKLIP
jgi:hypothetical protein